VAEPLDRSLGAKTAFVAGASSGINLAIARRLGAAGAKVAVISRHRDRIAAAAAQLADDGVDSIGLAADVRDYGAVESAMLEAKARFGDFDIVVSGAAGNFVAPALGISAKGFRTVVDIDLIGTFNVFRASFAQLRRPGASLIAISAPQGSRAQRAQSHVCAAKAGVNMLVKCLALEWGELGVRVNGVCPGPIDETEGMARLTPSSAARDRLTSRIPLGRYGRKSDIANAVVFLCSAAAGYVTGTVLDCDGGLSCTNAFDVDSSSPEDCHDLTDVLA
jgi:NAD(P)-dependent dehydrogenase (short-subunit alcohol dehydrogenase family)